MAFARVIRVVAGLLVFAGLASGLMAGPASAQRLVVAGAAPIHEVTLPNMGAQSSKLITRPMYEHLVQVDAAT